MKLNLLSSFYLKMIMSVIVGMKYNKCPGICKQFKIFREILHINLLYTVKFVRNRHLRFLKKGFAKARCPARQYVPLDNLDNYLLSTNKAKINRFLIQCKTPACQLFATYAAFFDFILMRLFFLIQNLFPYCSYFRVFFCKYNQNCLYRMKHEQKFLI